MYRSKEQQLVDTRWGNRSVRLG